MTQQDTEVLIVGAGIAGLTAAIALDREGICVEVLERATTLTQAGTALSLWPNALAALADIGLGDEISEIGAEEPEGVIRHPSGRRTLRLNQSRLSRQLGIPTLVVLRGDLQRVLLDAASNLPIRTHTPVARIRADGDVGVVELSDGETLEAPVVLACDGIHSASREIAGNPAPAYRGHSSWRAVVDGVSGLVPEACLTVGAGKQFIMSPLGDQLTYWAADVALPEGANEAMVDRKGFLLDEFAGWHDPIGGLISRTDGASLVIADIFDSVPRRLVSGRVALLGDAAHPMTPDLGQGACQGIEDAVVIAACLRQEPDPCTALARYQSVRLPRVRKIVRESRLLGQLATIRSPIGSSLRDLSVRLMPSALNAHLVARYASEDSFRRTLPAPVRRPD